MKKQLHLTSAVLSTGIMSFSGVLIETAMNVTFPTLIHEFGVKTSSIQWVTTIYLLIISIIVPISSYLNRNFSSRKLFTVSSIFFFLGVVTDCYSPNFYMLLLGRMLQGVGTGIGLPLMFYIILTKSPVEKRGLMVGIGNLTTSIAPAIGPIYGGIISTVLGWRYIYVFLIPILLFSFFLGLYSIPEEDVSKNESINIESIVFLALTFTGLLLALSTPEISRKALYLIFGILGGILFYRSNSKRPLISFSVFKNRKFTFFLIGFLVYQILLLGNSFILPNYLQIAAGAKVAVSGMFMFPGAMAGAILAPISGRLLDKVGAKKPIMLGLIIACIGILLLGVFLHTNIIPLLICMHVLFMIGLGLSYSNLMASSLSELSTKEQGDGNAIINTLQQFMGAVATTYVAMIFSVFQKSNGYKHGTLIGAQISLFTLFTLLIISCIFIFSAFKNKNK